MRTNALGAISIFHTDRDKTLPLGTDRVGSTESFLAWNKAVVEWLVSNYSISVCVCFVLFAILGYVENV